MNKSTRRLGWAVWIFTEILIAAGFYLCPDKRAEIINAQIVVFFTIWAAVSGKNVVDMKKESMEATKNEKSI